jgi:hypothetical protein
MAVAISDALNNCLKAACAENVDCGNGAPLCYIQTVVCSNDGFEYNLENGPFTYFNDEPMPSNSYAWFYGETDVQGTIANLHW